MSSYKDAMAELAEADRKVDTLKNRRQALVDERDQHAAVLADVAERKQRALAKFADTGSDDDVLRVEDEHARTERALASAGERIDALDEAIRRAVPGAARAESAARAAYVAHWRAELDRLKARILKEALPLIGAAMGVQQTLARVENRHAPIRADVFLKAGFDMELRTLECRPPESDIPSTPPTSRHVNDAARVAVWGQPAPHAEDAA